MVDVQEAQMRSIIFQLPRTAAAMTRVAGTTPRTERNHYVKNLKAICGQIAWNVPAGERGKKELSDQCRIPHMPSKSFHLAVPDSSWETAAFWFAEQREVLGNKCGIHYITQEEISVSLK